jgi:hypothetical protein
MSAFGRSGSKAYFALTVAFIAAVFLVAVLKSATIISWYRVAGFIPFSDAGDYFNQLLNWPADSFDPWNSRRPANSPLNILQFDIGFQTLLGLLVVRVLILALAVAFFVSALMHVANVWVALVCGGLLVSWSLPYVPTMLSETNGIALASAGYGCVLLGMQAKRASWVIWGVFGLALATALRPYNPMLPTLMAMLAFASMPWPWGKRLVIGVAVAVVATVAMLGAPRVAYEIYGHPEGAVGGNTGYTVLGLVRGTDWAEASMYMRQHYPSLSERQSNELMYEMALRAVSHDPWPALKSLSAGLANALWSLPQEVAGGFGWRTELPRWARWLFYMLLVATAAGCAFSNDAIPIFVMLLTLAAFLAMAPIVYNDGGWRIAGSLYPGLSMVAALPLFLAHQLWLGRRQERDGGSGRSRPVSSWALIPGQGVVVFAVFALPYPMLTRALASNHPHESSAPCVVVQFDDSGVAPQWTGLNGGRASRQFLRDWMQEFGFKEWEAFLQIHGESVRQLRNDRGTLVLIVADESAIADQPDQSAMHRWAPRFVIRAEEAPLGSPSKSFQPDPRH